MCLFVSFVVWEISSKCQKNALSCNVKEGEKNILDPGSVPLSESEAQVNEV